MGLKGNCKKIEEIKTTNKSGPRT